MASINGVAATELIPPVVPARQTVERKPKVVEKLFRTRCECCNGIFTAKERKTHAAHDGEEFFTMLNERYDTNLCHHCNNILGCSGHHMMTYKQAMEKLARVKANNTVLLLKSLHLGAPNGLDVGLDFGDVFRPSRIGAELVESTSKEASRNLLSVDILLAGVTVTLWPWEVSSIPWVTLMELKQNGDYDVAYTTKEDSEGYWTLTPKAKNMVIQTFGDR